jgi:hypothetical protein
MAARTRIRECRALTANELVGAGLLTRDELTEIGTAVADQLGESIHSGGLSISEWLRPRIEAALASWRQQREPGRIHWHLKMSVDGDRTSNVRDAVAGGGQRLNNTLDRLADRMDRQLNERAQGANDPLRRAAVKAVLEGLNGSEGYWYTRTRTTRVADAYRRLAERAQSWAETFDQLASKIPPTERAGMDGRIYREDA